MVCINLYVYNEQQLDGLDLKPYSIKLVGNVAFGMFVQNISLSVYM